LTRGIRVYLNGYFGPRLCGNAFDLVFWVSALLTLALFHSKSVIWLDRVLFSRIGAFESTYW